MESSADSSVVQRSVQVPLELPDSNCSNLQVYWVRKRHSVTGATVCGFDVQVSEQPSNFVPLEGIKEHWKPKTLSAIYTPGTLSLTAMLWCNPFGKAKAADRPTDSTTEVNVEVGAVTAAESSNQTADVPSPNVNPGTPPASDAARAKQHSGSADAEEGDDNADTAAVAAAGGPSNQEAAKKKKKRKKKKSASQDDGQGMADSTAQSSTVCQGSEPNSAAALLDTQALPPSHGETGKHLRNGNGDVTHARAAAADTKNGVAADADAHSEGSPTTAGHVQKASPAIVATPVPSADEALRGFSEAADAVASLESQVEHQDHLGPHMRAAFASHKLKGEDKSKLAEHNAWEWDQHRIPIGAFGIFDGHGGSKSATFCSKHLLENCLHYATLPNELQSTAAAAAANGVPAASNGVATAHESGDEEGNEGHEGEEAADAHVVEPTAVQVAEWKAQDELVARLPKACMAGFVVTDQQFKEKFKESGTTATLALSVGWLLTVANVGDSLAVLDLGSHVVEVSGNHRLDDNEAEQTRIRALGGELAPSYYEDEGYVGSMRVWPGGLAMGRTIGDCKAGDIVTAVPDVKQVVIPAEGARLIIGSDGLWDALQPKQAANTVRSLPAAQAASHLVFAALKKRGNVDDISVIVVDFMPTAECKLPPILLPPASGSKAKKGSKKKGADIAMLDDPADHAAQLRQHMALAKRRGSALQAAAAAQRAAQAAAERAAELAKSTTQESPGDGSTEPMSDMYRELAAKKLDAADVEAYVAELQAGKATTAEGDGDWETVPMRHRRAHHSETGTGNASSDAAADVPLADDAVEATGAGQAAAAGRGGRGGRGARRGTGRGEDRGPRGRGRAGGDRQPYTRDQQRDEQRIEDQAQTAGGAVGAEAGNVPPEGDGGQSQPGRTAVPDGGRGGRGGRGRGNRAGRTAEYLSQRDGGRPYQEGGRRAGEYPAQSNGPRQYQEGGRRAGEYPAQRDGARLYQEGGRGRGRRGRGRGRGDSYPAARTDQEPSAPHAAEPVEWRPPPSANVRTTTAYPVSGAATAGPTPQDPVIGFPGGPAAPGPLEKLLLASQGRTTQATPLHGYAHPNPAPAVGNLPSFAMPSASAVGDLRFGADDLHFGSDDLYAAPRAPHPLSPEALSTSAPTARQHSSSMDATQPVGSSAAARQLLMDGPNSGPQKGSPAVPTSVTMQPSASTFQWSADVEGDYEGVQENPDQSGGPQPRYGGRGRGRRGARGPGRGPGGRQARGHTSDQPTKARVLVVERGSGQIIGQR